jgi:hypothetical protein
MRRRWRSSRREKCRIRKGRRKENQKKRKQQQYQ